MGSEARQNKAQRPSLSVSVPRAKERAHRAGRKKAVGERSAIARSQPVTLSTERGCMLRQHKREQSVQAEKHATR
jgi:hypothetical protein